VRSAQAVTLQRELRQDRAVNRILSIGLASTLALLSTAAWSAQQAPPPIEIVAGECDAVPRHARIADGHLELQGAPNQTIIAWVEEHGIDLQLGITESVWIDSSPLRYAREPLQLTTDAAGVARMPVRIRVQHKDARLRLIGRCERGVPGTDHVLRYALLRAARVDNDSDGTAPLQMVALAMAGLAATDAGSWSHRWLLHQLASQARGAGLLVEAAAWYRRAADAAEAAGDPIWAALATLGHGQALFGRGDRGAEAVLLDAQQRTGAAGLHHPEAVASHDLCLVKRVSGRIEQAADCLRRVADRQRDLGEWRDYSIAQRNRANALMMIGRYDEARDALRISASTASDLDNMREQSLVWQMQATLARWGGDLDQSLDLLRKAQDGLKDDAVEQAQTQRLIADTYLVAGQPVRALSYYHQAHAALVSLKSFNRSAHVEVMMARTYLQLRQPERAQALLGAAHEVLSEFGSTNRIAGVTLELAHLQFVTGQHAAARDSLAALDAQGISGLTWQQQAQADVMRIRLNPDTDPAAVERNLGGLMARALRGRQLLLYFEIAEAALDQRIRLGDFAAARDLAATALNLGEAAAGRIHSPGLRHAVLSRLRPFASVEARMLENGPLSEAAALRALAPLERLRALEQQSTPMAPSLDQFDELERMLSAEALNGEVPRSEQRDAVVLALDTVAAGLGTASAVSPLALPRLAPDDTLLYFVAHGSHPGAFAADQGGWRWYAGLDGRSASSAARELQAIFSAGHGEAQPTATLLRLADALDWTVLLQRMPARLFILTDSELASVPWELLPGADGSDAPRAHREIVLLQSLRVREGRPPASVVAIAAAGQAGAGVPELQRAGEELDRVVANWPSLSVRRLPNTDQQQFEQAVAQPGGLVHVATHGRGDQGLAEDAGLWLLDSATDTPRFLSAVRIRHMQVRSALVVLSACDTGYSLAGRSFGMGGVAGSIVDAGADTVIGARWPVSDRAALLFSQAFHEALAQEPTAPARAVLAAQNAVRQVPALRHPTHCAGWFTLQSGPDPGHAVRAASGADG
jgi:tetratricopeptide (TPR) repeat protein